MFTSFKGFSNVLRTRPYITSFGETGTPYGVLNLQASKWRFLLFVLYTLRIVPALFRALNSVRASDVLNSLANLGSRDGGHSLYMIGRKSQSQ